MSWIITERATGRAILETYSRKVADAVNLDRYKVQEAGAYLAQLNATPYRTELTPAGEQLVIPGTERQDRPKSAQLSLW